MDNNILEVKKLKTYFYTKEGTGKAVDDIDIIVKKGKVTGIVGESGSGKTVTAMSIMRLIQKPGEIVNGEIFFKGTDLLKLSEKEMRSVRGNKIAMIFQEPMTSLNPVFTVGDQITEAIMLHQDVNKNEAINRAVKMLKSVGIPNPEKRIYDYPHQFSGGMRQRVMIAMALSCNPELLIADEPTTALDVTIQRQINDLMMELIKKEQISLLLITHDLGVVAETCDEVIVMYGGKVMEQTDVYEIFENPLHPYTIGLLNSIPRLGKKNDEKLYTIPGIVEKIYNISEGCHFCNRCEKADDKCYKIEPQLREIKKGHHVRCHKV